MKDWHREDIVDALKKESWDGLKILEPQSYHEGERLAFTRNGITLQVSFVADLGKGYTDKKSLEEAIGKREGIPEARLWLHRRRDSKWQKELLIFVEAISK